MVPSFRRCVIWSTFAAALLALAGCEAPSTSSAGANPRIPEPASSSLLRGGDSLVVAIQGVPDPSNNAVQIDESGFITLPLIGPINAGGMTISELTQHIRQTYLAKSIYRTVDVSVSVTERYVYVGGEVQRPGRIVWTPDLTVTKAIQSAGGFTLYAKETGVNLVRERNAYTLDTRIAQRNPAEDPRLMPGDSLQVPRSPF